MESQEYAVSIRVSKSAVVYVEAHSMEEAEEIASNNFYDGMYNEELEEDYDGRGVEIKATDCYE